MSRGSGQTKIWNRYHSPDEILVILRLKLLISGCRDVEHGQRACDVEEQGTKREVFSGTSPVHGKRVKVLVRKLLKLGNAIAFSLIQIPSLRDPWWDYRVSHPSGTAPGHRYEVLQRRPRCSTPPYAKYKRTTPLVYRLPPNQYIPDVFEDGCTCRDEISVINVVLHNSFRDPEGYGTRPPQ